MKIKYILLSLLATSLAMTACKDKTEAPPSAAKTEAGQSVEPVQPMEPVEPEAELEKPVEPPKPLKPSVVPAQRAAKLGFAGHLPKDITTYNALLNGRKAFDRFIETPLGVFLMERLEDEGLSLEDFGAEFGSELGVQIASYSEEYFTAVGPGAGEAVGLAMKFLERLGYYSARYAVDRLDRMVAADGRPMDINADDLLTGPLKGADKDLAALFSAFDMPAVYQGAKVSDAATRAKVKDSFDEIMAVFEMMPKGVKPITVKRGDAEFSGYKVMGEEWAREINDDAIKELQKFADIASIKAFKKALASKNLVLMTGEIGDYVILFIGKSEEDFRIVDDVNQSLCASDHMVFLDDYLDKDMLVVGFEDEDVYRGASSPTIVLQRLMGGVADGLGDALGKAGSLGDTSELEVLLDALVEQGRGIAALFTYADSGYVAYLEEGFKLETFGGSNMPELDLEVSHTLAPMATGDGVLLFANWASNPDYNEKLMEYVDTLGETGYLMAKRLSAIDPEGERPFVFSTWKPGIMMFEQMFRDDLLGIWQALRGDMAAGLGSETALVVDVNGSLPKIPQVPDAILKNGKMPRIAYVSTVDDRDKLKKSWQGLNKSIESILKKIGEISGGDIPMQVPMSSEKNALTTWFIPIPFQNDDFVPSVSVSDELFFASTSKAFSESLAGKAKQGGGEARKGAWLHVDFTVLGSYGDNWLGLIDKNLDEMAQPSVREDFEANKEMFAKALETVGSLDDLSLHVRREDGKTRTSLHIKAK